MFSASWINRSVLGIVLATFFSDFSHEMCTAVLPLYLATLGLGPAALGLMEGLADFLVSLSKLAGGFVGHHTDHKRPLASLGYLTTALATWAIGFAASLTALVGLRSLAWIGRGFRGPLRDDLLADAVEPTHYGRAYGLERAGDMLGAVLGPLIATLLIWGGIEIRTVILWTLLPGLLAASSIFFLTKERPREQSETLHHPGSPPGNRPGLSAFPRSFWILLVGVAFFGLGDFSRTFLIWVAAQHFDGSVTHEAVALSGGTLSTAVLLYALHNLVSALVAYPVGHLGDRGSKLHILLWGYGLGVVTNLLLAFVGGSTGGLLAVMLLSGSYIAVEETLEKAVAAELLPRAMRSLGFGLLACANAVGDMLSSLSVGYLLESQQATVAFGAAAAVGAIGLLWLLVMRGRIMPAPSS
jgi:MFS family permease